jgi:hypothetical protein
MGKVVQGTRSDKGLENHSVLRSLFETARRQGKKPHEFFRVLRWISGLILKNACMAPSRKK